MKNTRIASRASLLVTAALVVLACGRPRQVAPPASPEPQLLTGGCRYQSRPATCAFERVEGYSVEGRQAMVVWQPSIPGGTCTARFNVEPADYRAFEEHYRAHGTAPCTVDVESGGSCPPIGACRVAVPAFPRATLAGGDAVGPVGEIALGTSSGSAVSAH